MADVIDETEFKDFGKTPRWRTLEAQVTEKIDGTNAQIYVPEDPALPVLAGSRTQWIAPAKDNYGFASFVAQHADALRALGPGRHFGEWYGAGIQRRYGLDHRRLALFGVDRYPDGLPSGLPHTVHLVPVLYRGVVSASVIEGVCESLYVNGSVAVPGWPKPEGVVVRIGGQRWKITDNGDQHKGQTTTHREAVQSAAAEDRARETAVDRARKLVDRKLVDVVFDGHGKFRVIGRPPGVEPFEIACEQFEIRAKRFEAVERIELISQHQLEAQKS